MEAVDLIVCPILVAPAILGADYSDKSMEAILQRQKIVEVDN